MNSTYTALPIALPIDVASRREIDLKAKVILTLHLGHFVRSMKICISANLILTHAALLERGGSFDL